jgi:hypothetical protein
MLTWGGLKIPHTIERYEDGARVETACVIAVPAWGPVLRRHHLTPERYREMRDAQGGVCPMCGDGFWWRLGKMMPLVIDHDHACCPKWSCGRCVRGLLCHICNSALPAVERHLQGACYGPCPPAGAARANRHARLNCSRSAAAGATGWSFGKIRAGLGRSWARSSSAAVCSASARAR